ncbi:sulfatase [Amnibacterium endophyticum]|uniref:Sulfatase n=1 Tax=Amnibacterium endophyticum TaxID=2109337 RepID=A0ABW4LAR0_9MICO
MSGSRRPNFLFVITDQQRYDTIHALGFPHAETPVLDRLVQEGTAFTRAYVTAPSCAPSRASLFTGLYPHSLGVLRNDDPWQHSWVEQLAAAGYRCVSVGKMHTFPYEVAAGFHERHVVENKDRSNPKLPFLLDQWDKALAVQHMAKPDRRVHRQRPDYRDRLGAFEWELPEEMHADNFVAGLAKLWLDTYPRTGEPFFLQVGFPGPHPPYDPTPRFIERFADRDVPMPHDDPDDVAALPTPLQELRRDHLTVDHDGIVFLEDPTPEQQRRQRLYYLANVAMIDEQIGELLEALDRRGVLDDTVVIVTSDHGDCLGDHGLVQKWNMYEPSVHVPVIVRGPGVEAGQRLDGLVEHMDLGPTVLELAGVKPPAWMEARSLASALRGEQWAGRSHAFSEHARDVILTGTALMTMVRDEHLKLVEFVDSEEGQLFDLRSDPDEVRNRWDDAEYSEDKYRLLRVIARWRAASALDSAAWSASTR